jgi:tetratricopeptide (TPR) repeat protein
MNSPEAFYETTKNMKRYPSHFTAPFPLAGEWICGHADSGAAILTQWKDLACWVQGRKVLNASNTITPDLFENKLRDYEVRYVVSVIQKNGVHEFEFQAEQSSRFAFMPVARFSNAVIFEVRRDDRRGADRDTGTFFRKGIFYLDRGKYDLAEKVLEEGREADSLNVLCYFFTTVAKEFNMKLGEASERFHQLESYPQSLQFLDEASVHQQIIGLLAEAALSTTAAEKSELYFRSGAGYWDLGYRARGLELIEMALAADSSFVPAYVFGIHFNLLRGDTLRARSLLKIAMNIPADKNVFVAWKNILSEIDSLHAVQSPARRAYHYGEISTAYSTMRIFDSAIESALQAARETPDGVESLYRLAKLYVAVNRFGPARRAYERLLSLEPGNTTMQREHEEILRRF